MENLEIEEMEAIEGGREFCKRESAVLIWLADNGHYGQLFAVLDMMNSPGYQSIC